MSSQQGSGHSGGGQPAVRQANQRGAARLAAVQALYQMDVGGTGVLEIVAEYEAHRLGQEVDGALYLKADASWFRSIVSGVVENQKTVDPVIGQALRTTGRCRGWIRRCAPSCAPASSRS